VDAVAGDAGADASARSVIPPPPTLRLRSIDEGVESAGQRDEIKGEQQGKYLMIRKTLVVVLAIASLGLVTASLTARANTSPTVTFTRFADQHETVQVSGWGAGDHGATIYTNSGAYDNGGVAHAMYWTGDAHIAAFYGQSRGRQVVLGAVYGWFRCPKGNAVRLDGANVGQPLTYTPCP
jgi:hypothetical protein